MPIVKTAGLGVLLALGVRATITEVRTIPSRSMAPTLEVGDQVIVNKLSYRLRDPRRGDIVVFSPTPELQKQNLNNDLIKRIVAVPGDTLEIRPHQLWVNGQAVREPEIQYSQDYSYGPVTLGQGQYFVLGDNRTNSYDSHFWGTVSKQNLIGQAWLRIYPINRISLLNSGGR